MELFKRDKHEKRRVRIEDAWKDFDLNTEYLRDPTTKPVMKVSERDCLRHGITPTSRDYCAHILIPHTKCRRLTMWCPWRCKELAMAYERCQVNDFWRRRALVSRRFYELHGIDDGHDHRRNFEPSDHNPFDPNSHHYQPPESM